MTSPIFSRRHYDEIARAICKADRYVWVREETLPLGHDVVGIVIEELAQMLQRDNPRFLKSTFYDACQVLYTEPAPPSSDVVIKERVDWEKYRGVA